MALPRYSHSRAAKLGLITLILLILFPVLFNILFAARNEISLAAAAGPSTCNAFYTNEETDLARCSSSYTISIGNTGKEHQELVSIELSAVPEDHRLSWNSLDIVATRRAPIQARVSSRQQGDSLHLEIQDLQPNRLVEIRLSGRGIETARQMEDITIEVQSEGGIVQAGPRTTVSLRFLSALGGIFGL